MMNMKKVYRIMLLFSKQPDKEIDEKEKIKRDKHYEDLQDQMLRKSNNILKKIVF
nr:MAG TPA: hypothetical protein [Caudoviricetes sp.]